MKVINWVSYDKAETIPGSIDLMGGFFNNGMRWINYLENQPEKTHQYLEAIRIEVIKKGIRITGAEHQNSDTGAPILKMGLQQLSPIVPGATLWRPSGPRLKMPITTTWIFICKPALERATNNYAPQ